MKRIIKVSVFEFAIAHPSWFYINNYDQYDVKCVVDDKNLGILWDKYVLRLEGKTENIQLYLDYLKSVGFKIH